MTYLYLIRHGDYILGPGTESYLDQGLSPTGINQAQRLRDRLSASGEIKADILISSTMLRAQQTAEIIAPALGLPIVMDAEFEEWRNEDGTLSPEEFNARIQNVPNHHKPFFRWVPNGENWMEFTLRSHSALHRVLSEHEGKTLVIVCHGGIIEASFLYFFELHAVNLRRAGVDVKHTAITHWHTSDEPDFWILERYNDCHHLY